MPFAQQESVPNLTAMSSDVAYFNERLAQMRLSGSSVEAHGVLFCPANRLQHYGITSKGTMDRNAIIFPYLDENGENPQDRYQARMIGSFPPFDAPPPGLTREVHTKNLRKLYPKYIGSTGRGFDLYFPRYPTPWFAQEHVFITEGIPKAIRACQEGIPCLSIQGKDQFRLKQTNWFVPGLERLLKEGNLKRITYIADSDAGRNPDIKNSAVTLVQLLCGHKQLNNFADYLILPDLPHFEKTGLDDFLNSEGVETFFKNFASWVNTWEGGRWSDLTNAQNELLCWIRGTTNYVDRKLRRVIAQGPASLLVDPMCSGAGTLVNPYAGYTIRNGAASLANTFAKNPNKTTADDVDFWPGMPEWIELPRPVIDGEVDESADAPRVYNLWEDYAPKPVAGDITPFTNFLNYVIPDAYARSLLEQVIAHRIHKRSDKAPVGIFAYGKEGRGKSLLAAAIAQIITSNERYIHQDGMNPEYAHENSHTMKEFVCMEEPPAHVTKKEIENKLKLFIDNDKLTVNLKGKDQYSVRNRMLFWMNTNDPNFPASGEARRWLVLFCAEEKDDDILQAYIAWRDTTADWPSRLRKYYGEKYPNPITHEIQKACLVVGAKSELLEETKSLADIEYEQFVDELPAELAAHGIVPVRLMNLLHPYNEYKPNDLNSRAKSLSKNYPTIRAHAGHEGKVIFNKEGFTCKFRPMRRGARVAWDQVRFIEVYRAWEQHPLLKNLFRKKYDG